MPRRYWLFKSEPSVYSFEDLKKEPNQTACWDGIRNYQARNLLRDEVKAGDGVLFYHSNAKPRAVVGTAVVVREAYPDLTQFDRRSKTYDPASCKDDPRWVMVDIRYEKTFLRPVTLEVVKRTPALSSMMLAKKGARLSIQPVTREEWKTLLKLGSSMPPRETPRKSQQRTR